MEIAKLGNSQFPQLPKLHNISVSWIQRSPKFPISRVSSSLKLGTATLGIWEIGKAIFKVPNFKKQGQDKNSRVKLRILEICEFRTLRYCAIWEVGEIGKFPISQCPLWEIGKFVNCEKGKLGNWEIGKLGNWGIGGLGNWENGKWGNWEIGKLESSEIRIPISQFPNFPISQFPNLPIYHFPKFTLFWMRH